ncbi:hypothetical protein BDN70DRAFT_900468 [Pholiota conissans]|uniref:Uncharacterized protein n=1 Tax=Pholiota conissans TaxID=109636 RepID=A0A9P5YNH6_9AGAR|nr:hypothetical protein BDN70DRAFT_900468 [Pholiota conissans]
MSAPFEIYKFSVMQFNTFFIVTTLIVSAPWAMSATISGFAEANCTGNPIISGTASPGECISTGSIGVRSFSYSGVPNKIEFFILTGVIGQCLNGAELVLDGGSGCGTAPVG